MPRNDSERAANVLADYPIRTRPDGSRRIDMISSRRVGGGGVRTYAASAPNFEEFNRQSAPAVPAGAIPGGTDPVSVYARAAAVRTPAMDNRTDTQMGKALGSAYGRSPGFEASIRNTRALKKFKLANQFDVRSQQETDAGKRAKLKAYGADALGEADLSLAGPREVMQMSQTSGPPTAPPAISGGHGFFFDRRLASDANNRSNAESGAAVRSADEGTNDTIALRPGKVEAGNINNEAGRAKLPFIAGREQADIDAKKAEAQAKIDAGGFTRQQFRDQQMQLKLEMMRRQHLEDQWNKAAQGGAGAPGFKARTALDLGMAADELRKAGFTEEEVKGFFARQAGIPQQPPGAPGAAAPYTQPASPPASPQQFAPDFSAIGPSTTATTPPVVNGGPAPARAPSLPPAIDPTYGRPLGAAGLLSPAPAPAAPPAPAYGISSPAAIPTLNSPEEADRLPRGSRFKSPDGIVHVVP